jgi:hypothetical protein
MFWKRPQEDPKPLVNQMRELETRVKQIEVEWEDVYEKLVRANARLRKRERDAATPEKGLAPTEPVAVVPHVMTKQELRRMAFGGGNGVR